MITSLELHPKCFGFFWVFYASCVYTHVARVLEIICYPCQLHMVEMSQNVFFYLRHNRRTYFFIFQLTKIYTYSEGTRGFLVCMATTYDRDGPEWFSRPTSRGISFDIWIKSLFTKVSWELDLRFQELPFTGNVVWLIIPMTRSSITNQ